ncbi:tetratricopeptide repeat protein [Mariniblastus sp.]|nr:tetratricopeptide repeat protein [Mariniblastus sp.]
MSDKERNAELDHYEALDLSGLLAIENESPDDIDLLILIGQRYFRSQNLDKCRDYYVRALELDPLDGWSHLYFGNLLYALQCYDDALTHFKYAADFLPDVGCPHWCMGDAYHALGDMDNADLHFHKAVEIDPDDPGARQNLKKWIAITQR